MISTVFYHDATNIKIKRIINKDYYALKFFIETTDNSCIELVIFSENRLSLEDGQPDKSES